MIAVCPRTLCDHARFRALAHERYCDIRWNETGRRLEGEELVVFLSGAERVVVGIERLDAAIVARLPSLRVVAKFGVGLDNLDLNALEAAGVHVGWTPGVNRRAVAELTLAGVLALLRGLPEGDRRIRAGDLAAGTWRASAGRQLSDEQVGIIGCGHVGLEVARLMRAFGARVLAYDIRDRSEWLAPIGVPQVGLDELLPAADVVTLHTPLDETTRGLLDAKRIASLRTGAFVVNTARGGLIDEGALLDALDSGRIAGAFLDVLQDEPAAPGPLVTHPRVLVSAHIGGSTAQSIDAMADAALSNLENAAPVSALRARLREGQIEPAVPPHRHIA
jgi:D-3-phosphoglycerate dehydrogenase